MNRRTTLATLTLLSLATALTMGPAIGQEKQHVSFKSPAETSKYTQQVNIDVGDVPNHIVRAWEVHRTYPNAPPTFNGIKLVEEWERGIGDRIDGNGDGRFYHVYVMENGDKFFVRNEAIIQRTATGKLASVGAGHIFGGTGKLESIQGTTRNATTFDPKAGVADEGELDIEYLMGR